MKISYVDRFGRWSLLKDAVKVEIETFKPVKVEQGKVIVITEEGEENGK